jgi:hypothetical protein
MRTITITGATTIETAATTMCMIGKKTVLYGNYLRKWRSEYCSVAGQRREPQKEYWRWRHLHPGVVVEFHR